MNLCTKRNINGELITLTQTCELSNLGTATVRRIASEANAVRKIGKNYRINRQVFFDYIENNFK